MQETGPFFVGEGGWKSGGIAILFLVVKIIFLTETSKYFMSRLLFSVVSLNNMHAVSVCTQNTKVKQPSCGRNTFVWIEMLMDEKEI